MKLEHKIQVYELYSSPESTSLKFLLLGRIVHEDEKDQFSGETISVSIDFAPIQQPQCVDDDFEKWYLRDGTGNDCILGRKVSVLRAYILL